MKVINLHGVVGWDITARDFAEELDKTTGDVTLDLNSPGGYITEGIAIFNKIRSYDKGKITARVSYAASMMTQIALAADEVQVYDNSIFMIHNALGVAMGDYREMEKRKNVLKSMSNMLSVAYVKKTKKPQNQILKMMDDETYLFGDEIVNEGFADILLASENDENRTKDEAVAYSHLQMEALSKALRDENVSLDQLSACIGGCNLENIGYNIDAESNTQEKGEAEKAFNPHNKENKTMNITQLKAEHPEVFAEAVTLGVTQERERVSAHLTMGEASGDMALALTSINNGDEISAAVNAKYMAAHMKRKETNDRQDEGVPPVNTPKGGEGDEDKAMAEKVANLLGVEK